MRNKSNFILFFFLASILLPQKEIFPQKKILLGITIAADASSSSKTRGAFGISFERMVSKHNSAEIGFYYRTAVDDNLVVLVPSGANFVVSEQFFVVERFVSIPLVYNYKSKPVNMSVGFSADIYTGWKEQKYVANTPGANPVLLQSYKFDHKILWGAIAKITRTIRIDNKLLVEPYVYYNPVFTPYSLYSKSFSENRQYYGVGLAAKYIF